MCEYIPLPIFIHCTLLNKIGTNYLHGYMLVGVWIANTIFTLT